jgi:hypothetical protein
MKIFAIVCVAAVGFSAPAFAGTDWGKECASYGLAVGSAEYKDCVAKMTDADKATGGTMGQNMNNGSSSAQAAQMRANADAQRKQMQADMARQRAQMQAQMNQQMQDAKSNPKCKTVTNGTNTVTQCP